MTTETCVLCGGTAWMPMIEVQGHRILNCEGCGLARTEYLKPVEEAPSADLYSDKYYVRQGRKPVPPAKRVYQQWPRVKFLRKYRQGGRLLDMGCGQGFFVARAKQKGFDATGVDVSAFAREFAKRELGVELVTSTMEDAKFPPGSFDIVTMWHSLEHTVDPMDTLRRIHSWLRPGGLILIEVSDYGSYDAQKMGAEWEDWSMPYHRWHFTPEVVERMLKACGFTGMQLKHMPSCYVRDRLRKVPVIGWFRKIIWRFFRGNFFRMVAEKPNG